MMRKRVRFVCATLPLSRIKLFVEFERKIEKIILQTRGDGKTLAVTERKFLWKTGKKL